MTPELLKPEADNCDAQSGLSPASLLDVRSKSKRIKTDGERDAVEMMQTCPGFRIKWYSENVRYSAPDAGFNVWQVGCGYPNWEELYEELFGEWLDEHI